MSLAMRRMNGVKTVSSGAVNRQIPQAEFQEGCRRHQQEAAQDPSNIIGVVKGLWKTEGFASTMGKYRIPANTLNDPKIPRESYGITHVGFGAACTEHTLFDTGQLIELVETLAEPNYKGLMYEGMGSIVRIYEPGIFKFMCGQLGLIPKNAPPGPDSTGFYAKFFSAFPADVQWLITHGYGRLVGFSKMSVYKAIEEGMTLPAERVTPCVQGTAFAFTMMNTEDMARLLEASAIDYPAHVRAAFQNGMVYAMTFCDWFVPGFLAAWRPAGKLGEKLGAVARAEAALNQKRGYPLAFRLENPIA
jgi:hypothetical protein